MLPIRTSISPKHTPYVNYLLIAVNVIIFLLTYSPHIVSVQGQRFQESLRNEALQFMLIPNRPYIWQFVTYAFLHSSILHLLGNMYFLFIFGNNVNDRLGNVGYLCFYLAGAVFSGIGHSLFHSSPVLGASGAVAAVTGAYMVLFPNTLITVFFMIFFFWDVFEIRALYLIVFKLIFWDNILESRFSSQNIAYNAHLAGYFFGIACILLLITIRLMESDPENLLSIIRQWNRRRLYRKTLSDGYDPYKPTQSIQQADSEVNTLGAIQDNPEIVSIRNEISAAIANKDIPEAARLSAKLLDIDTEQTLSRQNQLDVANQLMSEGQWTYASRSYENYLAAYSSSEHSAQVELMLGLIYTRYLHNGQKARKLLDSVREKLTVPSQIKMCDDLLKEL